MTNFHFDLSLSGLEVIQQIIRGKMALDLNIRDRFNFLEEYIELVTSGRKKTTIRFRRGMIDCPVDNVIPVFSTSNSAMERDKELGWARILSLRIIPLKDLNEVDALNDGFFSVNELRNALREIYGDINETEFVSVYEFDYFQHN
ncbi:MAG TPA: ASCH domain-containing protein [Anaerolineales bacterium]|nr:ASCH domain-containing protein [Anaerolineales bacterium]